MIGIVLRCLAASSGGQLMEDRSLDPTSESSLQRQGEFFNLDINKYHMHNIQRSVPLPKHYTLNNA